MGTIDEIRKMQGEGRSEGEIRAALKQGGISEDEISEAFSQTQIKDAVASGVKISDGGGKVSEQDGQEYSGEKEYSETQSYSQTPQQQGYENMQPSMVSGGEESLPGQEYSSQSASGVQETLSGYPGADAYSGYPSYQPYQESISSDMITEISDQVVSERLSYLQDKMEKALNFRTIAEAKTSALDERVKRIEKILDKLQLDVLQKVGEYVSDVRDIKTEIQEDRKSFKALRGHRKHSSHKKKHSKN